MTKRSDWKWIILSRQTAGPTPSVTCKAVRLFFPDSIVPADKSGKLKIAVPLLKNQLELSSGHYTVVGSAYDITEQNGVVFQVHGGDSIQLVLDIAGSATAGHKYCIGLWNPDSLQWKPLANSTAGKDGKTVSAYVPHFSRYAVLTQSVDLTSTLSILPNPFSPDKKRVGLRIAGASAWTGHAEGNVHFLYS
jgi:hypothetical protein